MKRVNLWALIAMFFLVALIGCGGSTKKTTPPPSPYIWISPTTVNLSSGQTQQFTATVSNTPNTAVTWSLAGCSGTACGTISSTGLYTAPATITQAATVRVVATLQADTTIMRIAFVTHNVIQISISEYSVMLGQGETHQFTATVYNTSNTAVTWSVSGCEGASCGTITETGLYTAPASIASEAELKVIATSKADPNSSAAITVRHMPVTISVSPARSVVLVPGAMLDFEAVVLYDIKHAGVSWSLSPACTAATCGALTNASLEKVTYTTPASVPVPDTLTLVATALADSSRTVQVTIKIASEPPLKEGDYAFLYRGRQYLDYGLYTESRAMAAAGWFHADINGNITAGVLDFNEGKVANEVALTGKYYVGTDGRGELDLVPLGLPTMTLSIVVDSSATKGSFAGEVATEDAFWYVSGGFERQDNTAFSLAALGGNYVLGMSGGGDYAGDFMVPVPVRVHRAAAVGRFTAAKDGTFSNGKMDAMVATHSSYDPTDGFSDLALTGSFSAPSANGRGTLQINPTPAIANLTGPLNFVYYVVSPDRMFVLQNFEGEGTVPILSGEIRRQHGTFSSSAFSSPVILSMTGVTWEWGAYALTLLGQMIPDGSGNMTGSFEQSDESPDTATSFTGTYTVGADGRSAMTLHRGSDARSMVAYFYDINEAFMLQNSEYSPMLGFIKGQTAGPFSEASLSGNFVIASKWCAVCDYAENFVGVAAFDGKGKITASVDTGHYYSADLTGTYTVGSNGRGTITFNSSFLPSSVFWVISSTELVSVTQYSDGSNLPVLLEFHK